jgi:tetraacyldisaccharide 4'-kinase
LARQLKDLRGRLGGVSTSPGWMEHLASRLYGSGAWLHRHYAERLPLVRTEKPVISLGNLEVGGTGKTPATIALAQLLLEGGRRPGILTGLAHQGGGRKIFISGEDHFQGAPDEARLIASRVPEVVVVAAARKWRGAMVLDGHPDCDCIIMDDGFQHHRLSRLLDLVLISGREPLVPGKVLPAGTLREFPGALTRADFLLIHPRATDFQLPPVPRILFDIVEEGLFDLDGNPVEADPAGYLTVAAIAAPERFEKSAAGHCAVHGNIRFRDHMEWSGVVAGEIEESLLHLGDARVLLTEKDAVRWQEKWDLFGKRPHCLRIRLEWRERRALLDLLISRLEQPSRIS